MGFIFKNLNIGEIISSNGGIAFRKLSPAGADPPVIPPTEVKETFDLRWLGLKAGTYIITVTACADGYLESEHSNPVKVTIE